MMCVRQPYTEATAPILFTRTRVQTPYMVDREQVSNYTQCCCWMAWIYPDTGARFVADTLFGNQGKDVLFGEDGADVYYGNAGVDHIYPGAGDTVYGGGKLDKYAHKALC
eukprot:scaffold1534_cov391-Prasinococcus_capsulatus_cf.AAC.4